MVVPLSGRVGSRAEYEAMPARPPAELGRLVRLFRDAPEDLRVAGLHDHGHRLPPLPDGVTTDDMEQVTECQAPVFVLAELLDDATVSVSISCPPEAPTTRGFAAVVYEGVNGATLDEVLAIPDDLYRHLGIDAVVTGQRLDGMEALIRRLKRQLTS